MDSSLIGRYMSLPEAYIKHTGRPIILRITQKYNRYYVCIPISDKQIINNIYGREHLLFTFEGIVENLLPESINDSNIDILKI